MRHNNWEFKDVNPIDFTKHKNVKYAIIHNNEGYVEMKDTQRLSAMVKISPTASWKKREGTAQEARDRYLVEPYIEFGEHKPKQQGKRTDIDKLKEAIKEGAPEKDLFENHTLEYLKYQRAILAARRLYVKPREGPPEVILIIGPTGSGKTKYVAEREPSLYWKQSSQWWDGYDGHPAIVLDEFKGWIPFTDLLRLLDRYPYTGQIKGGHVEVTPNRIYITSNYHPNAWYKQKVYNPALYRRFTAIKWFLTKEEHYDFSNIEELDKVYVPPSDQEPIPDQELQTIVPPSDYID